MRSPTEREQLLFFEEVCDLLRAPPSTVRQWTAAGRLNSLKLGRRRLYRRSDVDAFLESGMSSHVARASVRRR